MTRSHEAVLVHPDKAWAQIEADSDVVATAADSDGRPGDGPPGDRDSDDPESGKRPAKPPLTRLYGQVELDSVRAIRDLEGILKEVVSHLRRVGNEVNISVEVNATADGFDAHTVRVVRENATQLGFASHEFEE